MNMIKNTLLIQVSLLCFCLLPNCSEDVVYNYVSAYGDTFTFNFDESGVPNAEISILEYPSLTAYTDENGSFEFHKLISGTEATFVFSHPDYTPNQTGTFTVKEGEREINHFTNQGILCLL